MQNKSTILIYRFIQGSLMTYAERVDLYKQIEEERERPLITYVTSSRPNAEGIIASDVIPEICRQILKIPPDKKEIDLLVVSRGGGDPIVSWRIVSLLRERFESVNVLIPMKPTVPRHFLHSERMKL